jgi:3-phytase
MTKTTVLLSTGLFLSTCLCTGAEAATHRVPAIYPTPAAALAAAADGDTIRVAPGTYRGALDIGAKGVTLLADALTYEPGLPSREKVGRTVLDGDGGDYVIHIAPEGGAVTIRGFTMRNASDGIAPYRPFTLSHSRILETSDGIDYEAGGGLAEYCYFEQNRDDGIDLDGPIAVTIRHSVISDNRDDGIEIRFQPYAGDSLHTLFADNEIARNGEDGIQFIDYEEATPRAFRIERNRIVDNAMVGIAFMGEATTREDFRGDHVDERVDIVHNTLLGNPYGIAGAGNVRVVNTIVAGSQDVALKNLSQPGQVTHVLLADNGSDGVNTYLDASNVLTDDPRLAWDGRPRDGSPAVDAGAVIGDLAFVGGAPDIGAHERRADEGILPVAITDPVSDDSDDPAIWVNRGDPTGSLVLGTDKAGRLYAFDLSGHTVRVLAAPGMRRLNNVDVQQGVRLGDRRLDIAVATDRDAGLLWAWSLPDFTLLTPQGLPVFVGEADRRPMGVALYERPADGALFATLSRKSGPDGAYLWQYRVHSQETGLALEEVRHFGAFSGLNAEGDGEIEAISVDDETGRLYYSDELYGLLAYHADPAHPQAASSLAVFGRDGFADDREGIAIAPGAGGERLLVVSDQGASRFRAYDLTRKHAFVGSVALQTESTDGCEVYPGALPGYPGGLFVAMSDDRTFQFYDWREVRAGLLGRQPR